MNSSVSISSMFSGFIKFIKRFHTILFFLVVSGGLFAAIVMLLATISLSSTTATSSSQTIDGSFDEATITRLKEPTSGSGTPGRRSSPFTE